MNLTLDQLLGQLWRDYIAFNPHARTVHDLLTARGETIVNDHIAFRTFDVAPIGLDAFAAHFTRHGYVPRDPYTFPDKKLTARHYEHPDPKRPLIFISQLLTAEMPASVQAIIRKLVGQLPPGVIARPDLPHAGRLWNPTLAEYKTLADASEYAGWLAAFGFHANHFTVRVNDLKTFKSLQDLNDFLETSGIALNAAGGKIKGTPAELLEQSSTLAGSVKVTFADGSLDIPACYYEFARRYPRPDGSLFTGFIARSADKIFQSTDRR